MTAFYATTAGGTNLYLSRTFCCEQSIESMNFILLLKSYPINCIG